MDNLVKALSTKQTLFFVLVLALIAQMPHAQHVFSLAGQDRTWFGWVQSWFGAIALELAVLVFVMRSNVRVSWGFALFSVCINLMYYYDAIAIYLAPLLLAPGLPIAIALYSHEFANDEGTDEQDSGLHVVQESVQVAKLAMHEVSRETVSPVQESVQVDDWVAHAMTLRVQGASNKEIALAVGKHQSTVSRRLRGVDGCVGVSVTHPPQQ